MLDQIAVYVPTISNIRYNWEAEHFKQFRFALLWQGQARLSGLVQIGVMVSLSIIFNLYLAVITVFCLNVVWSLFMVDYYEGRRESGAQDIYQTLAFRRPRAWWGWVACPFKLLFIILGLKEWSITQFMIFTRFCCSRLPWSARKAQLMVMIIGLSLTGILAGHHQLNKAGYTGSSRRQWNRIGRLLNAPTKVLETFVIYWLGFHFWVF